jgi:hypothetical protein
LPAGALESRGQQYVTVQLAEAVFRDLSSLLEHPIMGLIRLWLTAYPEDLSGMEALDSAGTACNP